MGRFGERHHVLLNEKRCTCMVYDKVKISCGHALMTANELGVDYATLAEDYYKTSTRVVTYEGVINP